MGPPSYVAHRKTLHCTRRHRYRDSLALHRLFSLFLFLIQIARTTAFLQLPASAAVPSAPNLKVLSSQNRQRSRCNFANDPKENASTIKLHLRRRRCWHAQMAGPRQRRQTTRRYLFNQWRSEQRRWPTGRFTAIGTATLIACKLKSLNNEAGQETGTQAGKIQGSNPPAQSADIEQPETVSKSESGGEKEIGQQQMKILQLQSLASQTNTKPKSAKYEESVEIQSLPGSKFTIDPLLSESKQVKNMLRGAQFVENFLSQPWVEVSEAFLVIMSTFLVAVDTLSNLSPVIYSFIAFAGDAVAYIFCFLFFLRWYANSDQGPKYLTKPFVLVDIVVVILPLILPAFNSGHLLPSWLTSKGGLINLRLLRIIRLQRVLTSMDTFASFQRALGVSNPRDVKPYELQLARVLLSLFTLLSVATGLIYTTEHNVNPALPDYFTALYFGLTTLTTVGFGDITPVTIGGKLVVSGSILAGVAIIPAQAAALFEALLDYEKQRNQEQLEEKNLSRTPKSYNASDVPVSPQQRGLMDALTPCPSCGATMHWDDASFCWSCGNKL